ncbi:HNH endonuclease [Streptomyces mauvecolor]|uniref:HNH endonuclease n=1 Tax=Streptomyces mauvecolor TaxID=58345 RepID=A0ABV9UL21_9ACTN
MTWGSAPDPDDPTPPLPEDLRAVSTTSPPPAALLRRRVQERGKTWCGWCPAGFPASGVDLDHVCPLSLGGEDMDSNVHVLCHGCHHLKTATEFGAGRVAA